MNTGKIKVIFNALAEGDNDGRNDYGTRIQIKCHQKIERKSQTFDGEKCVNWEFMDSFGINFVDSVYVRKFYASVNWRDIGLRLKMKSKDVMRIQFLKARKAYKSRSIRREVHGLFYFRRKGFYTQKRNIGSLSARWSDLG